MQNTHHLQRRESLIGFLFAFPAIVGLFVFFIVPFMVSIYYSLSDSVWSGTFIGFRNYTELFKNSAFQLATVNTAKFIAVAVPLILACSLGIAFLLFRKLRGYNFFRTVFILPLVLPTASVILVFQIVFHQAGALNSLLAFLHLPVADWLHSSGAFAVLVVLYLWKNTGYNVVLFFAALNSVPTAFYEAADINGATNRQKLFRITLPLITHHFFFIVIISIINTFKVFREAFILCGNHPHKSIYMLQHFINNNFQNLNYTRLSTGAMIVFAVIFLFVLLLFKLRKNRGMQE